MREGLRSGKLSLRSGKLRKGLRSGELRERHRRGGISSGKDKTLPKLINVHKDDESCMESTKLDSFSEFKTESMDGSDVGCSSGEGLNECQTNGILQYSRKRVRDDNGEGCVCLGEEKTKKKGKKENSECELHDVGRVLRSQTRSGSHLKKEVEIAESGCTEIDTSGGPNDNLLVKIDDDGANQSVEGLVDKFLLKIEDDGANQSVEGLVEQKAKKKRGRPRKIHSETVIVKNKLDRIKNKFLLKIEDDGANQSVEGLVEQKAKKKRGRPPKIHSETVIVKNKLDIKNKFLLKIEDDGANQSVEGLVEQKAKKKRGRPPKIHSETVIVKNKLDRIKKIGARKGQRMLRSKGRLNKGVTFSSPERSTRLKETASSLEILSPAKRDKGENLETGGNSALPQESSEMGNTEHNVVKAAVKTENSVGEGLTRASEKQLVRNRIIELLLSAGWTIDYRPRNGRDYNDAVYVSVDGKTHWSVTKAYKLLKQRYEEGDRAAYKEGFVFLPIPADELFILNKVMTKKREGKKAIGSQESKNRADRAVRKKKKGKHSFAMTSSGKPIKRKKKVKSIPSEDDESAMEALCHTPWSFGKRKRRDTKRNKRCTFLVRSSDGQDSESNGYVLYKGKRTTLSWMIDLGIVPEKANVSYMVQGKTEVMLKGIITTDGIDCNCCGKVITISEFESHAGSKLCQPLQNTCIHDGIPLVQCLLDAWKKQEKSLQQKWFYYIDIRGDDTNDDTCGLCGDGGNLVCCDGCPSTFHQRCVDIQKFPPGDWHCLFCCCKFCGTIFGNANGREEDDKVTSLLLTCGFCKEKYHRSCSDVKNVTKDIEGSLSFCGKKCQEIYDNIEMLLGVKHEMEEGFSWTLLNRSDVDVDISSKEITRKIECNCKIAVALSVMDECFLPMPDHRSGINLIHNIMYNCGSNFNRLDFSGFYTVTLEKGEETIAAATVRIHGNILAEMPFIGTRYMYRRQGMCRRLLNAIESVLCSLDVKKLVIPAVSDLEETWTSVFGFEPLDMETQKTIKRLNLLVFPGVAMLQKLVASSDDGSSQDKPTEAAEGLVSESVKVDEGEPIITDNCHFLHQNGSSPDITTENIGLVSESVKVDEGEPAITDNCHFLHQNGSSSDITTENIGLVSESVKLDEGEPIITDNCHFLHQNGSSSDITTENIGLVSESVKLDEGEHIITDNCHFPHQNGSSSDITTENIGLVSESVKLDEGEHIITDNCHFLHQNGSLSDITTENIGFSNCATGDCREIVVPSSLSAAATAAEPSAPENENGVQKTDAIDKDENVNAAAAVDQNLATSNEATAEPSGDAAPESENGVRKTDAIDKVEATPPDIIFVEVPTVLEALPAAGTVSTEGNGASSIEPESLSEKPTPAGEATLEEVADDDEKRSEKVLDRESIEEEEEEKHEGCELKAVARIEETTSHEVTDDCHFLHNQNGSSNITTENIGFPNCATDDLREIAVTAGDAAPETENCNRKNDPTVENVNAGDQNLASSDGATLLDIVTRSSDGSEGCRDVETVTGECVK